MLKKPSEEDFENLTDKNITLSPFENKEKNYNN